MRVTKLYGVYNADGGIVGEMRYVIGHLLGTTSCSLCDITHSPIRRKPEWDAMVQTLPVPLAVLHRNELNPELSDWISSIDLPAVIGHTDDGHFTVVLGPSHLDRAGGSVSAFRELLTDAMAKL
jgi:hypothetical protein